MLVVAIMVKNEGPVIIPTLESYYEGGIKQYLLYDTGSTDDTIEKFHQFLKSHRNAKGKVYQRPFTNFADSRNVGLDYAKLHFRKCKFVFMPDAEWYLINPRGLVEFCQRNAHRTEDYHHIFISDGGNFFATARIFNNQGNARFFGAVHETANGTIGSQVPQTTYIKYVQSRGGLAKTQNRWYRDLGILLQEVQSGGENPEPRNLFYLAQTQECLAMREEAIKNYIKRSEITAGYVEEQFMALYRVGKIYEVLNDWDQAEKYYLKAYNSRPQRIEPLVKLAAHYPNDSPLKYMFAHQACMLEDTTDLLFIEKDMYKYERWNQLGLSAAAAKQYEEGYKAVMKALKIRPNEPHLLNNKKYYLNKMPSLKVTPGPIKILNLILYSESPEYIAMYQVLSKYLKAKSIPHFFYAFKEGLASEYQIVDDILYFRGKETYIPGILDKTLKVLQYFKDKDYDYIVRSNMSTVINFEELKNNLDEKIDYGGPLYYTGSRVDIPSGITEEKHVTYGSHHFVSGMCILLSKRAVQLLVENSKTVLSYGIIDDVSIGIFLHDKSEIVRASIGIDSYSMDNSTFKPKMIAYRNKTDDRMVDVATMKAICDHLIRS